MCMCARARKRVHLFSSNELWMKRKSSLYQLARQVCNGHLSPHEPSSPACSVQGPSAILFCIHSKCKHLSWSQIGAPFLLGKKCWWPVAEPGGPSQLCLRGQATAARQTQNLGHRPSGWQCSLKRRGCRKFVANMACRSRTLDTIKTHTHTHVFGCTKKNVLLRQDSNEGFNALNSTAEGKILLFFIKKFLSNDLTCKQRC